MNYAFTVEEIRDAARIARIYCPDLSNEKFESLIELARRVNESGYLETVEGLRRLEKDKGIPLTRILDASEALSEQKKQQENEVADFESRLKQLRERTRQAQQKYTQIQEATKEAEGALAETRAQHEREAKEFRTFQKRAEAENQRIEKEVGDCYHQANVTKEEVATAGQIKADAESRGVSLKLVMNVAQELANHDNVREEFILGVKEHNSFKRYLEELDEWARKRRAQVLSDISNLQSQQGQIQAQMYALEETRRSIEGVITGLQATVAEGEELRRFYWRYYGQAGLLELLASWQQLFFFRCGSPISAMTRGLDDSKVARLWTNKPAVCCPHCGSPALVFDEQPYQLLGLPVGVGLKLELG